MLKTPTFAPINSLDDTRLVTLIAVAMNAIETLALEQNIDPDFILSEQLFLTYKHISEMGADCYLQKLVNHYPLLAQAIS